MKTTFLIICCLTYVYAIAQTEDYCASSLCGSRHHIACDNDGSFASSCAQDRVLIDILPYKAMILDRHNYYRNLIASGSLPGFDPAERMATMEWDDELSKMAEYNVKRCRLAHDRCRNLDRFLYSGQNLAWSWSSPIPPAIKPTIRANIDNWFGEYKDASMQHINEYQSSPKPIGHFTVMVVDKNSRVGCAGMKQQSSRGGFEFFFACNYASTNVLRFPVYKKGSTCSKCSTGRNPEYPALCSVDEDIDVNNWFDS